VLGSSTVRAGFVFRFSATLLLVSVTILSISPADANSAKVPRCHSIQVREALEPVQIAKSATQSYEAWVTFTNTGELCNMPVVNVSIEAFSGSTALASSDIINLVIGNNYLKTGDSARALIGVGRTNDPAVRKTCSPKPANRFVVFPIYQDWPRKSFPLSSPVLVCTGLSDNLASGVLGPKSP
jgi:hypothetical protein